MWKFRVPRCDETSKMYIIHWYVQSKVKKVFAQGKKNILKKYNIFDTLLANIEYANGVLVSLEACWVLPKTSPGSIDGKMEVIGNKGALYIDTFQQGLTIVNSRGTLYPDTRHWPEMHGYIMGDLQNEIIHFLDCILNQKKPIASLHDAIYALKVATLIEKSVLTGNAVLDE